MNTRRSLIMGTSIRCLLALLMAIAASIAGAAEGDTVSLEFGGRTATELRLSIGRSQIITSGVPLEQVVIGAPDIADIKLLSSRRVLILGIKPGRTNLVFRQKDGDLVALMDVIVGYDLSGIKYKVHELMPKEDKVEVRDTNDRVILAGQVSSALAMDMALSVARSYVPAEKVTNLLQVAGGQQVMLEARVAEVSRSSLKQLGVQTALSDNGGKWSLITGQPILNAFGTLTRIDTDGTPFDSLTVRLQALEEKGLAKTLAEPNIVALSGQEANFLAGGEIPIPVAQTGTNVTTITVDYKEFGVGLRFTPTVLDPSKINLKLLTEVSEIDTANSFSTGSGINLPTIATRRAGTTIELADGQSFAIAGLLSSNMDNAIKQFPLLGSIPVLGALFRSTDFQRDESELVVVVTARLVKPTRAGLLALPTDVFTPPSDLDQYLLGRLEGTQKQRPQASAGTRSGQQPAGGLEGAFGHQLNAEVNHARH